MTASAWLVAAGAAASAAAGLALLAPTRMLLRRHDADPRWCSTPVAAAAVALTAGLCAALTWRQPHPAVLAAALCLAVVAAPLAIIDLAVQRLPDLLVVPCYAAVTATLTAHAVYSGQLGVAAHAVLAATASLKSRDFHIR
jgi:leader peptidase (prepilin peptidase)/N-methyltransferase